MEPLRVVLLGKTGSGKSSCGNTILDEKSFTIETSPSSVTFACESRTSGKNIMVVDTPGFFDTDLPEEKLKSEIVRCVVECAPGPHVFVIVLKVERYTKHEMETVKEITASFGEEALKYSVVLFTRGDELSEEETIEDFVKQSEELQELVDKCGGRVHVVDNKHWTQQQEGYRSNRVQIEKLLNTIEEMVKKNEGRYYSNEMLQIVNREIDAEYENIRSEGNKELTHIIMRLQAIKKVFTKLLARFAGAATGALLGALLGAAGGLFAVLAIMKISPSSLVPIVMAPKVTATVVISTAIAGAAVGGYQGYKAAEGAETVTDAVKNAAKENKRTAETALETAKMILAQKQKEYS